MNDKSLGTYNLGTEIKFKTTILSPSLCHYSDAHKFVKGTTTTTGAGADVILERADERNK